MPAPSTITAILRRHGRIDPAEGPKHRSWQRFEHQAPNDLWQMDFKGHFPLTRGRCHPLTVLTITLGLPWGCRPEITSRERWCNSA